MNTPRSLSVSCRSERTCLDFEFVALYQTHTERQLRIHAMSVKGFGQVFDRQEFIRRVAEHLHIPDEQAELIVRAVFAAIQQLPGELEVEGHLPSDLQELWDSAAQLSSR